MIPNLVHFLFFFFDFRRILKLECNSNSYWGRGKRGEPSQFSMKSLQLKPPPLFHLSQIQDKHCWPKFRKVFLCSIHTNKPPPHLLRINVGLGNRDASVGPTFSPLPIKSKLGKHWSKPGSQGWTQILHLGLRVRGLKHYLAYTGLFVQDLAAFLKPNVDGPWLWRIRKPTQLRSRL